MRVGIDFDGTVVSQDRPYADVVSPLEFVPGAKEGLLALKAAGSPERQTCGLLDDQARITRAARGLGMYTILVGTASPGEDADAALLHLTELPGLLEGRI